MVGVPGKYKGCETCRSRRVKCSNERPFCQKCLSSGRNCEGYERERVFITGTVATRGRVASHPKKETPVSKKSQQRYDGQSDGQSPEPGIFTTATSSASSESSSTNYAASKGDVMDGLIDPTTAALWSSGWDDSVFLGGALRTQMSNVAVSGCAIGNLGPLVSSSLPNSPDASLGGNISTPSHVLLSDTSPTVDDGEFRVRALYIAHWEEDQHGSPFAHSAESYHVFLYADLLNDPIVSVEPWVSSSECTNWMQNLGPERFASFPKHYFFVRVYRPLAVSLALRNRTDTFLSTSEWMTAPWQKRPKSSFDRLFDIALFLPSIFALTVQILSEPATFERRNRVQELLHNCLILEKQFDHWLDEASQVSLDHYPAHWTDRMGSPLEDFPFRDALTFRDAQTGVAFLYYWMIQILLQRCIGSLNYALFEPLVDAYADIWPVVTEPHIDPLRHQQGHVLAASICRGLKSVLRLTTQPDILLPPMEVALEFYRDLSTASPDGFLETIWLDDFREELVVKGQHIAGSVQGYAWQPIAKF